MPAAASAAKRTLQLAFVVVVVVMAVVVVLLLLLLLPPQLQRQPLRPPALPLPLQGGWDFQMPCLRPGQVSPRPPRKV